MAIRSRGRLWNILRATKVDKHFNLAIFATVMSGAKVAVVILNWNGQQFLEQFLPSVTSCSQGDGIEVWVADNGSTDESLDFLQKKYPTVKILAFDQNYGFTGGYNRALKEIQAEYYVLLNSDIEVTPNWIEPIITKMDADQQIAAAMPKLKAYHDKNLFEYAGAAGGFIDKFGFPFCRGRMLSVLEEDQGQYDVESEIFWATGACLFVRAEIYHAVEGLDELFFAHMEEIDLCWRLKNRGYKVMYYPQATVYHVGGGTLPNNNPRKLFLNYRNNLFLLYKNLPQSRLVSTIFIRLMLDGISAAMYLLQGKLSFFWAVPKAHFAFYRMLGHFAKTRKKNKKLRTVYQHKEMYKKSLVLRFFMFQKHKFSDLSFK